MSMGCPWAPGEITMMPLPSFHMLAPHVRVASARLAYNQNSKAWNLPRKNQLPAGH